MYNNRVFFMKKHYKKIILRIIAIILSSVSFLYLLEIIYDKIQYVKAKPQIQVYNNQQITNNNKQKPDLSNYVLINKNCAPCINDRKGNAGCVISKDNKILLVRYRRTNQISLPGGFRDYRHRDTFVASEEMRNSLGYIISIEDVIKDFNHFLGLSRDSNFRLYKCNIIQKTKKTNKKIIEEFWVDKNKLKEKLNSNEIAFKKELQFVYDKFEFVIK